MSFFGFINPEQSLNSSQSHSQYLKPTHLILNVDFGTILLYFTFIVPASVKIKTKIPA